MAYRTGNGSLEINLAKIITSKEALKLNKYCYFWVTQVG